jgi:hypothetical protein
MILKCSLLITTPAYSAPSPPPPPIDLLNTLNIYKSHQRVKKGEGKLRSEFSEEEASEECKIKGTGSPDGYGFC